MRTDVVVVGGGIAGLTAARTVAANGLQVMLLERDSRCGGVIHTERLGGFVVDAGPDTLLAHKPAALALVREVGLSDRLVAPLPDRSTYVLRDGTLRSLPQTTALGLPTDLRTVLTARAFSWRAKLRMAAEPLVPRRTAAGDESIASFVGRRFGREAVTFVAEPVLAGLHRGDAHALSLHALFPVLASAEQTRGSVARYWSSTPPRQTGGSMSLRTGIGELVNELQRQLPGGSVRTSVVVTTIERQREFTVMLGDGTSVSCRALLLATPAYAAAPLVTRLDQDLARFCGGIRYVTATSIALGYRREDVRHPLQGWGCVIPRGARGVLRSVSWVSSKWPGRAPEGHVLLRAALAGENPDEVDDELASRAHEAIAPLLSVTNAPVFVRVYRRPRAMPQLEVGHKDRMQAIDRRLAAVPGLFLSASGFRGVGLPDCIADAQRVAAQAVEYVQSHSVRRGKPAC